MTVVLAMTSLPVHMSCTCTCTCTVPDSYLASCPGGVLAWTSQPAHVHICLQCWRTTQHTSPPILPNCPSDSHTYPTHTCRFFSQNCHFQNCPSHTVTRCMLKFGDIFKKGFFASSSSFLLRVCSLVMHSSFANAKKLIIYERAKKADERKVGTRKNLSSKNPPALGVKLSPLSSSSSTPQSSLRPLSSSSSSRSNERRIPEHGAGIICIKEK